MILHFIRHGQTDWNTEGKIQGSVDTELNNTGIIQAEELSRKVLELNLNISKIYTSRQKRALKTAQILSEITGEDYEPIDGIEEINLGEWEGLTWDEVKEKYPGEYNEWYINRRYTKPPKGESYQDMLERVLTALHKIIRENYEEVTIVTHSAVIMCLQCLITDTPFNKMGRFKTENTNITDIDSILIK
jgi:probable phosphoglycerate mutase